LLAEIKSDHELSLTPVIVLTTSRSELDIRRCYALHANCYVVKPVDLDRFFEVIRSIERFWFTAVMLPNR